MREPEALCTGHVQAKREQFAELVILSDLFMRNVITQ